MKVNGVLMASLLVSGSVYADPPSVTLLEFIGEWQEVDNEWLDPLSIEETDVEEVAEQQATKSDDDE